MSCLGRIVIPALFCLAIAGAPVLGAADDLGERQSAWYFLGASTDRYGNEEQDQPGFSSETERRSLDDFRTGERYQFSLRYTDLGEPVLDWPMALALIVRKKCRHPSSLASAHPMKSRIAGTSSRNTVRSIPGRRSQA